MKYTHLSDLPPVIQRAILEDDYDRGALTDISVTELIDSPRIFALKRLYKDYITVDARNQIHSIVGRAVHKYLQGYARGTDIAEERLYTTIDGIVLSGSMDIQEENDGSIVISDYKTWKVEKLKYPHDDLEKQLNTYAYLAEKNGKKVSGLKGIIILKDWSMEKSKIQMFYPQSPVETLQIPIKGAAENDRWVRERIALFKPIINKPSQSPISSCSIQERWGVEDTVSLRGRKASEKTVDAPSETRELSLIQKIRMGGKLKIGEDRRCAGNYCNVSEFCDQYKEILRKRNELRKEFESVSANK